MQSSAIWNLETLTIYYRNSSLNDYINNFEITKICFTPQGMNKVSFIGNLIKKGRMLSSVRKSYKLREINST